VGKGTGRGGGIQDAGYWPYRRIATGKSTVSQILAEMGFPIIDADLIAREVVEPGKPAYREIVRHSAGRL